MEVRACAVQPSDQTAHDLSDRPQIVETAALRDCLTVRLRAHRLTSLSSDLRFCNWKLVRTTLMLAGFAILSATGGTCAVSSWRMR